MSDQERNDGGPAFGGAYDQVLVDRAREYPAQTVERRVPGLSVRDYFADSVMQELLADHLGRDGDLTCGTDADIADDAYKMADAMLAAREGGS